MRLLGRVDQLRRDAYSTPRAEHCTFHNCVNSQFARDLAQRFVHSFVLHRRSTRDHPQLPNFGQRGNERFSESLGEILLLGVSRQVLQGQHCERFDLPWAGIDAGDETIAPTGKGFDVAGFLGGVAQRCAQSLNRVINAVVEVDEGVRRPDFLTQFVPGDDLPRSF